MCRARPRLGQPIPRLLDLDASIVTCHSENESAAHTRKKTFGYHPRFCFLDNSGEALAALLVEDRAGSSTTADHISVLDQTLPQIPDEYRGFLAHIRVLPRSTRFIVRRERPHSGAQPAVAQNSLGDLLECRRSSSAGVTWRRFKQQQWVRNYRNSYTA